MQKTLDAILRGFVCVGRLSVRWPDGQRSIYAGPEGSGPEAGIKFRDARTIRRMVLNPTLAVGEAYMDGGLVPDGCGIYDAIELLALNVMANATGHPIARFRNTLGVIRRRIDQYNPASRARRNVAHHYDLNGRLYSLFLDRDRQYSCAYFPRGDETLEEAQIAKKRHIAAKLCLDRPGLSVLDIGCGWGGMALTLARDYGAQVTGITLSTEQLNEARARAAAEGLQDRVTFELLDYRALDRRFDRIVSVGMFEHVGVVHYREFFNTVARSLNPEGVALLHAIGRSDGPGFTNPWIAKYIFPGGYCPALSEVIPQVEKSGLIAADIEILRLHYAETLRHWRRRFEDNRAEIARLYDERFCRMWEFYLTGAEMDFRYLRTMVFQMQIAREIDAVPIVRDYMVDGERAQRRHAIPVRG
jgi:cyclopropane-fatty-acyl-phospholipid synthase